MCVCVCADLTHALVILILLHFIIIFHSSKTGRLPCLPRSCLCVHSVAASVFPLKPHRNYCNDMLAGSCDVPPTPHGPPVLLVYSRRLARLPFQFFFYLFLTQSSVKVGEGCVCVSVWVRMCVCMC